ncbi:MAG: hypothetical protein RMA76_43960 [Deltaproteobacteria bacterium]
MDLREAARRTYVIDDFDRWDEAVHQAACDFESTFGAYPARAALHPSTLRQFGSRASPEQLRDEDGARPNELDLELPGELRAEVRESAEAVPLPDLNDEEDETQQQTIEINPTLVSARCSVDHDRSLQPPTDIPQLGHGTTCSRARTTWRK